MRSGVDAAAKWIGAAEASVTIRCVCCKCGTTVNELDTFGLRYRAKFLALGWRKLAGKWVCPWCVELAATKPTETGE
jgi:hypothetical protein